MVDCWSMSPFNLIIAPYHPHTPYHLSSPFRLLPHTKLGSSCVTSFQKPFHLTLFIGPLTLQVRTFMGSSLCPSPSIFCPLAPLYVDPFLQVGLKPTQTLPCCLFLNTQTPLSFSSWFLFYFKQLLIIQALKGYPPTYSS